MIAIGDALRERFGSLGTEREGVDQADIVDGLPVDRTLCPRCFGHDEARRHCHVCKNEPVCPTCRNGRVLSVAGRELRYVVCPSCCYDVDQRTQTGVPMWTDNAEGRKQAIRSYRLNQWRDQEEVDDDNVPF